MRQALDRDLSIALVAQSRCAPIPVQNLILVLFFVAGWRKIKTETQEGRDFVPGSRDSLD